MSYRSVYPPIAIAFVVVLILASSYFFPIQGLQDIADNAYYWATLVAQAGAFLGLVALTRSHLRIARRKTEGYWGPSIVFLVSCYIVIIFGVFAGGTANPVASWFRMVVYEYSNRAILALLGPIVIATAYRVMLIKSIDVLVFVLGTFFVIMQNAPIGGVIWSSFPVIGEWVQLNPMSGVIRGLAIIIALNLMVLGIRFMLGWERSLFGIREE